MFAFVKRFKLLIVKELHTGCGGEFGQNAGKESIGCFSIVLFEHKLVAEL